MSPNNLGDIRYHYIKFRFVLFYPNTLYMTQTSAMRHQAMK